jgi:hypothetical protein
VGVSQVDLFAPAALSPGPLADTPIRSLHADFDNVWARGESSPMKVKRHGLVVILLFISITLVTGMHLPIDNARRKSAFGI